ncbi:P1 family peptidase [Maritimibacter sp. DP1N21-5]|uniref:P1 family peptidase n=1 Tax=Maritimibacter sp. DP1N21-5 TaxID=2836867 RepID=UPI001C48FA4A|nr:P1 family peptidase [Maritimibacter sp. DP1N21-5]MBV7409047.1 P1 family peptidase [Maritimibacter sp. DP1N21-5]
MRPGPLNLITDVAGLRVGNASDAGIKTGTTVLVGDAPFVAGVHVMGGAPGTRETDLLAPDKTVQEVDALVLSGGSAFGLDAASGVADALRAAGRGFFVGSVNVPIVPGAILFDLINGGDKDWQTNPYKALGRAAIEAADSRFDLGSLGAGTGALCADMKGGLGSASLVLESGITVGALVAVNPVGGVTGPKGQFWANLWEMNGEFGASGPVIGFDPSAPPVTKLTARDQPGTATTIAIVATDAALTQAQATRLAVAAHDGMARAIHPSHTPHDGDLVFAAATGARALPSPDIDPLLLGHAAATCLARAIARGVYHATPAPGDLLPTWQARFGSA